MGGAKRLLPLHAFIAWTVTALFLFTRYDIKTEVAGNNRKIQFIDLNLGL
jgi:hypothetical protein